MEYVFARMIESALVEHRGNAATIRDAVCGRRPDVTGDVVSVSGDKLGVLNEYPSNIYGQSSLDGKTRSGETLFMLSGGAKGQSWEILSTSKRAIRVVGGADLVAAGVKAGDSWEIRRAQDQRAIDWFSKTSIRVVVGYPQDSASVPCYSIVLASAGEKAGGRRVGNLGSYVGQGGPGPVSKEYATEFDERYTVMCMGITQDSSMWLYKFLEYVYRRSVTFFEQIFEASSFTAQGAELQPITSLQPHTVFARTFTFGGPIEKIVESEVEWLVENQINPSRQVKKVELR